jgi:hypothetical protein
MGRHISKESVKFDDTITYPQNRRTKFKHWTTLQPASFLRNQWNPNRRDFHWSVKMLAGCRSVHCINSVLLRKFLSHGLILASLNFTDSLLICLFSSVILIVPYTDTATFWFQLLLIFYVTDKYSCWLGSVLKTGWEPIYTSWVISHSWLLLSTVCYSRDFYVLAVWILG